MMSGWITRAWRHCALWIILVSLCDNLTPRIAGESPPDLLARQNDGGTASNGACSIECKSPKRRPVCGTDSRTYTSKCALRRARRCDKKDVELKSAGTCPQDIALQKTVNCLSDRSTAENTQRQRPNEKTYIPSCNPDGGFAPVQCYDDMLYCWCVTEDGRPIPNTTTSGSRADCNDVGPGKKHQRRRASPSDTDTIHTRGADSKVCTPADRAEFNKNIVIQFSKEFFHIHQTAQGRQRDGDASLEKRVVDWKFSALDKDNDNKLKRTEIRQLKKMTKKLVKPKSCARTLEEYCDRDKDKKISRKEWSICLGVDMNKDQTAPADTATRAPPGGSLPFDPSVLYPISAAVPAAGADEAVLPSETSSRASLEFTTDANHMNGSWRPPLHTAPDKPSTTEMQRDTPVQRDCREERKTAEDDARQNPDGSIYIPQCTENGEFRQAQCHEATGICWCLDPKTWDPIPGYYAQNIVPNCSHITYRTFKGCLYAQKRRFLTGLMDQLTDQMAEFAINSSNSGVFAKDEDADLSVEARAVRWKLRMMDTNHNSVLERKETKDFKTEIQRSKKLRKCGRNFLRYCDEDNDKKITLQEWEDCTGIKDQGKGLPNPKRRGQNPLNVLQSE